MSNNDETISENCKKKFLTVTIVTTVECQIIELLIGQYNF